MKTENTLQQQVFEYLKDAAEKIGEFAQKEIPPFIEEFLKWKFVEAGIWVGLWIVCFVLFAAIYIIWIKKRKNQLLQSFSRCDFEAIFVVISGLCVGIGLMFSFFEGVVENIFTMVQIHVAPKVFLLEEAHRLFN